MKRSLSILLLMVGSINAMAQTDIGIKAGLSIPNLTSGDSKNPINKGYGSRLGPDASIQAEFHLTKRFSIQPEIQYSSQGGKKNGNQAFSTPPELAAMFPDGQVPPYLYADYKSTAKFNYLMIPILAKYHFLLRNHWDVYAAAGPFVSFVLNAKNITSGSSTIYLDEQHTQPLPIGEQSFDRTENIKKDLHSVNAGVDGHIGVAYHLKNSSIFVEGGGNYGFVKIQKGDTNGKNNTGAAVVVVGYAMTVCRK
jgi:hypothetical protein